MVPINAETTDEENVDRHRWLKLFTQSCAWCTHIHSYIIHPPKLMYTYTHTHR